MQLYKKAHYISESLMISKDGQTNLFVSCAIQNGKKEWSLKSKMGNTNRFYLSEVVLKKLFSDYNVNSLEELREKLESNANQLMNNCFFGWVDQQSGDETCPIMKRNPKMTDEEIAKRFCKICPRYLSVVGTKTIQINRTNTMVHSTPRIENQNSVSQQFNQSDWDAIYSKLILQDFEHQQYVCLTCRVTFTVLSEVRSHVIKFHDVQLHYTINRFIQESKLKANTNLHGTDTGYGSPSW